MAPDRFPPPLPKELPAPQATSSARRPAVPRRIDSRDLVGSEGLLEIAHDGAVYRLRVTSLGKLILTK